MAGATVGIAAVTSWVGAGATWAAASEVFCTSEVSVAVVGRSAKTGEAAAKGTDRRANFFGRRDLSFRSMGTFKLHTGQSVIP